MDPQSPKLLIKLAIASLVLVYLVFLAGAVVRATGSGMGCPDWPKCFGKMIPPTDSLNLPPGYKQLYVEKRKAKNERMATLLRFLGAKDLAEKILNDPDIYKGLDFNAAKAWIEYVNRLCGVLLGFSLFGLVVTAWRNRRNDGRVLTLSLLAFMLTVLTGWLGSIVVSTNLLPGMITLHTALALGIMALMTGIIVRMSYKPAGNGLAVGLNLVRAAVILSLIQIFMGTQVREQVDQITARIDERGLWLDQLDAWFYIHRSMALLVLLLNGYLFYRLRNSTGDLKRLSNYVLAVILLEILAGVLLSYLHFPVWVQPAHLILAVLMFGLQIGILLRIKKERAVTSAA